MINTCSIELFYIRKSLKRVFSAKFKSLKSFLVKLNQIWPFFDKKILIIQFLFYENCFTVIFLIEFDYKDSKNSKL